MVFAKIPDCFAGVYVAACFADLAFGRVLQPTGPGVATTGDTKNPDFAAKTTAGPVGVFDRAAVGLVHIGQV